MKPSWLDKAEYARLREIGKAELRSRDLPIRATFLDLAMACQWLGEQLKAMGKPDEYRALMGAICGGLCAQKMAPWGIAKTIVEYHEKAVAEQGKANQIDWSHDNCINCNGTGWVGGMVGYCCDSPVRANGP